LISFKCNIEGALSRALEKPPAVERGVLRTREHQEKRKPGKRAVA
jgi:hypothetical protein